MAAIPLKVVVLIPAAGAGTRMGGLRKQFRLLGGKPLLMRTLEVFERHPQVDAIVLSLPRELGDASSTREFSMAPGRADAEDDFPDASARFLETMRGEGIRKLYAVVAGGDSRQESVANALSAAPPSDVVLVHDGARPFLSGDRIDAVLDAVRSGGAASLAIRVSDTIRRGRGGYFGETVDRDDLYRMQTPQGFRTAWLLEAHDAAREGGYVETDDVALLQRLGRRVRLVDGSTTNIKITTPQDWLLAEAIWRNLRVEP